MFVGCLFDEVDEQLIEQLHDFLKMFVIIQQEQTFIAVILDS